MDSLGRRWRKKCADSWPGEKAQNKAQSTAMDVEPRQEPECQAAHPYAVKCAAPGRGTVVAYLSLRVVFKQWVHGLMSVRGRLPRFLLRTPEMSASELPRLPEPASYNRWDTPFQLGRLPFDVQSCPFWHRVFACFESLELLSAQAVRLALRSRLAKKGWARVSGGATDDGVASSASSVCLT